MILGALIGPAVVDGDVVQAISQLTGRASIPIVLLFAPGVAVAGAICMYGGALAVITLIQTFVTDWRAHSWARVLIATAIFVAALLIGLVGASQFSAAIRTLQRNPPLRHGAVDRGESRGLLPDPSRPL